MKKIRIVVKDGELYFQRLTLNQRIQHIFLFVSFTLLAATGLPLKFHHTWWGEGLYTLVGGITIAPIIHRISAVVMTLTFLYHLCYVIVCAWKYYILPLKKDRDLDLKTVLQAVLQLPMVPNATDLKELKTTLKYFLFLSSQRPSLVAHGLKEKFGYLAVFWGIPVIGISGYLLWGETFFTGYFSGNVLNFAYIAHSDEALLASIVIFIWHLYNVHWAPAVFPMGKAWLDGFMSEKEMSLYHYADYVRAMEDAGLQDQIKSNCLQEQFKGGFLKQVFQKIYMGVMIVAICYATVVICRVIYESVFVLGYQIVTTEPTAEVKPLVEPQFLEEIMLEDDEQKTFYRGYRFVKEKEIKNHYHRIELEVGPDTISHCITCHGDLPHGNSVHIRSFLNMHNLYFACQTCHVRPGESAERLYYYWYKRTTGEIISNPDIGNRMIDTLDIKLTPCETCTAPPENSDIKKERAAVKDLMDRIQAATTSVQEKKQIVATLHQNVAERPLACSECHSRKEQFLPLQEMGFSEDRIALVASDQITKMIQEYKEFHTPEFLEPGTQ